ncbi:MAG: hypothetical protein ABIH85_04390 [Candidatus Omnitrophota bacterium]
MNKLRLVICLCVVACSVQFSFSEIATAVTLRSDSKFVSRIGNKRKGLLTMSQKKGNFPQKSKKSAKR